MSFKSGKHHYRYEHAPHRVYLPTDITVPKMYDNYMEAVARGELDHVPRRDISNLSDA